MTMNEEKIVTAEPIAEPAALIRKYCVCGAVMVRGEYDGLAGWVCPDCDYFIPDPI